MRLPEPDANGYHAFGDGSLVFPRTFSNITVWVARLPNGQALESGLGDNGFDSPQAAADALEKARCSTCGGQAWPGCRRCANCWEVETRLDDYLKTVGGRDFVDAALKKIGLCITHHEGGTHGEDD